jgi:tetratricopeptide (TPR) repeat protein
LAIDAGLAPELSHASELLGLVAYAQGEWQEIFGREFLDTVRRAPELAPFVFDAHMCMSEFALWEADGIQATASFSEEILAAAEQAGSVQVRALGLLLRGESTLLGDHDPGRARPDLEEAARLHEDGDSSTGWTIAVERLAQLEVVQGRADPARQLHRRALELAGDSAVPQHLLPFVFGGMLEGAESDEAARIVTMAEAATTGLDVCDPCSMPFRVGAAVALARMGDIDQALGYLREAGRVARMWSGGPWHAAVSEARSAVRQGQGASVEEVSALLREAAAGYAAAGRPRQKARCRFAAASLASSAPGNGQGTAAS